MRKDPVDGPFLAKHLEADSKESVALFKLVSFCFKDYFVVCQETKKRPEPQFS